MYLTRFLDHECIHICWKLLPAVAQSLGSIRISGTIVFKFVFFFLIIKLMPSINVKEGPGSFSLVGNVCKIVFLCIGINAQKVLSKVENALQIGWAFLKKHALIIQDIL